MRFTAQTGIPSLPNCCHGGWRMFTPPRSRPPDDSRFSKRGHDDRLKTIHLERPFSPIQPLRCPTADISAARNLNNPHHLYVCILICTYILVNKNVPAGTCRKIAVMFLQEHSPANSAPPRPDTPPIAFACPHSPLGCPRMDPSPREARI